MREHRLGYCSPSHNRDVVGGVVVGVCFVSANHTPELLLGFPIGFGDMSTRCALAAGVAWIDGHHRKTGPLGLIFDKGSKLTKSPIMQAFPLRFIGLTAGANVLEVFKSDPQPGAFGSGNDVFGNAVVLVFLEPLLFAAHRAKAAFGGAGSDPLQGGTALGVSRPIGFYFVPSILVAQTVGCDINNPHIDTQHTIRRQQSRIVKITHGGQIPLAANVHQINFALAVFQQSALMLATRKADFLPTTQQPQRNGVTAQKPQDSVIVRLGGVLAKNTLCFLIGLVRIRYLGNAADCNLSRQAEALPDFDIRRFVKIVLPEGLGFPCPIRQPVTGFIATLKRFQQRLFLRGSRFQLEIGNQFHSSSIEKTSGYVNSNLL